MNKQKAAGAIALALCLVGTSAAQAATLTYSVDTGARSTPVFAIAKSLPQFDPSLGTLTGVGIQIHAEIEGYGAIENLSDSKIADVTIGNRFDVQVQGLAGRTDLGVATLWLQSGFSLSAFDGTVDFLGHSGYIGGGFGQTSENFVQDDFSSFIGTGVMPILMTGNTLRPQGGSFAAPPFNYLGQYFFADLALVSTAVQYTYEPALVGGVPEPASWAMLIAGFGLTGAAMRRRRLGPVAVSA